MFDKKQKFLFKCKDCNMILSVELEDEEDLISVQEDKMILECPCEGKCYVLRD
jgi:hypothetical protein